MVNTCYLCLKMYIKSNASAGVCARHNPTTWNAERICLDTKTYSFVIGVKYLSKILLVPNIVIEMQC